MSKYLSSVFTLLDLVFKRSQTCLLLDNYFYLVVPNIIVKELQAPSEPIILHQNTKPGSQTFW